MQIDGRYACQVRLPGFGAEAQARLRRAKVLVVGAGGLGCPASQYLTSAGVGHLTILDFDRVSEGNLHRQILFGDKDVGEFKTVAAAKRLHRQNPDVRIEARTERITADNVLELVGSHDIVVDCTDNFEARYLLNDACVLVGKPLVYGAAYQYQGQVAIWNVPNDDGTWSPHYRDVFPAAESAAAVDCTSGGVVPTLTGTIGCMQANETIKYLAGLPGILAGRLLIFDALTMQTHIVALPLTSSVGVKDVAATVPTISAEDLRLALPGQLYDLVDVRSADEHAGFNIGGRHMPLEEVLDDRLDVRPGQPIVFYCRSGRRSAVAARHIMQQQPGAAVLSLEGGMLAWQSDTALV